MRQRMSHGLRRALQVSRRLNESLDIARNLRRALAAWPATPPSFTPPRFTGARDVGSGTVAFDAQLCGRSFRIEIAPIDYESADRIEWETHISSHERDENGHEENR